MTLRQSLRAELASRANADKARGMQAYMKSAMPYYGVNLPELRIIGKQVFAEYPLASCEQWQGAVMDLWRQATFREERYAAIELLGLKRHRDCWTPRLMPALEEMVLTGAWWDLVDGIAHVFGDLLRKYPEEIRPVMRAWSTDENLWKRRISIICQLSFKRETDLKLLYANIEPNLSDREFFIRKAIGWALRQYAWTDSEEVARYVAAHESQLSGLSRREALKNLTSPLVGRVARRAAAGRMGSAGADLRSIKTSNLDRS
jgi:3-methyladenine DNA glycosylase AlkD